MTWFTLSILLVFSLESVLGGYSTGFHRTPKPDIEEIPIVGVLPPSPPKQRFVGHHEGSIGEVGINRGVDPTRHPKQRFVGHHEGSIGEVGINRGVDPTRHPKQRFVGHHGGSIGVVGINRGVDPTRHPKQRFVGHHEGSIGQVQINKDDVEFEVSDPSKPAVIVIVKDCKSCDEEEENRPDIPEDLIIDQIHKEENPGQIDDKPIIDPPKDVYIEERPALILDEVPKDEQLFEKPEDIPVIIEEKPADIPIIIEEKPADIPIIIEEKPVNIPIIIEERPIPVIPSEPDDKQIKVLPEIPYPVKVTNENSNLNLYEMLQKLQLSRFVHLVEEAGLDDLLSGDVSITIFAPSDYALSKLKADEIRRLATDKDLLRQFVLYHCVDGSIFGSSLINDPIQTKIDRNILMANYYGEKWYINGVELKIKDQVCKNGAIHVIDTPLYPIPTGGILETLEASGNFNIFLELIRNAKLDEVLKGEHRWTIFAPTDAAFSKLPPASVEWLKWDIPAIKNLFNQVTCRGYYYTSWINSGSTSPPISLANESMDFSGYPDSTINGISLSQRDITADNGCIHGIDDMWFSSNITPSEASGGKKH